MALISVFFSSNLMAQKKQNYEGSYTNLVNRTGDLKAEFIMNDEDTVFDGDFFFVIKQDLKDGHRFIKETYQGIYEKGLKQGKWEYDQLDLNYSVIDIENEKVKMIYWGKKEVMDAIYEKGVPEGLWSYAFFHVDSSGGQKVEKVGSIHFENGKAKGEFAFRSLTRPRYEISGTFDSIGRLHDAWEIVYFMDTNHIREQRIYDDGFLKYLIKKDAESGELIDSLVYEEVINKLETKTVPKAEGNYNLLFDDGFLTESPLIQSQIDGNKLLQNAYETFLWADLGRGSLDGAKHDFNPGTGRFEYDLPESFINDLNTMRSDLKQIIKRSDSLLNDPRFEIYFHQSEILSKSQAILLYEKQKSNEILELVNSRADSLYRHIDRDVYFADIYKTYMDRIDTLKYDFDGESKTFIVNEIIEKDLSPFYKLQDAVAVLNDLSENAMVDIRKEFELMLQKERLTALENDMIFTSKKIKSQFTKMPGSLAYDVHNKCIEPWKNTKWQQYTNLDDLKTKESEGRYILGVLEDLEEIKDDLDRIESRELKIDSAYTEYVFDPYTYSENIKKRIKKRLYDDVAIEYYERLKKELTGLKHAEDLNDKVEYIKKLQSRLIELSKENTRSLEKKLRKSSDFENIDKWLELE